MTGGDPACWLGEICAECGRVREEQELEVCVACGHRFGDAPGPPDRDRDESGRARSSRPRDGLGRPLPYGAPGVERPPEGMVRTPAETLSEAQRLLDAGMPFHAHEVLEDAWKQAGEAERGLWRGLAQLAVGLTHAMRGNVVGACSLLNRGTENIVPYTDQPPHDVDVAGLGQWGRALAAGLAAGTVGDAALAEVPRLRRRTHSSH